MRKGLAKKLAELLFSRTKTPQGKRDKGEPPEVRCPYLIAGGKCEAYACLFRGRVLPSCHGSDDDQRDRCPFCDEQGGGTC